MNMTRKSFLKRMAGAEPVIEEFESLLKKDKFKEKISIKWHEDAGVKLSFPITFE